MRRLQYLLILLLFVVPPAACTSGTETADNGAESAAEPAPASQPEPEPATEPDPAPEATPEPEPGPEPDVPPLLDPAHADMNRRAPDQFRVALETTKGDIIVEVHRDWAPHGADRFYNLVRAGYYDGTRFFRMADNFVAQFGMNGDPEINAVWSESNIPADPQGEMNTRGRLTFAHSGSPDSRSAQLFINLGDNLFLDSEGFPPFGEIVDGMGVVGSLYTGYGESPNQGRISAEGNAYLERDFPLLDYIRRARVVGER